MPTRRNLELAEADEGVGRRGVRNRGAKHREEAVVEEEQERAVAPFERSALRKIRGLRRGEGGGDSGERSGREIAGGSPRGNELRALRGERREMAERGSGVREGGGVESVFAGAPDEDGRAEAARVGPVEQRAEAGHERGRPVAEGSLPVFRRGLAEREPEVVGGRRADAMEEGADMVREDEGEPVFERGVLRGGAGLGLREASEEERNGVRRAELEVLRGRGARSMDAELEGGHRGEGAEDAGALGASAGGADVEDMERDGGREEQRAERADGGNSFHGGLF